MPKYTENLQLYEFDHSQDDASTTTFNVQRFLNDNWDKIDDAVGSKKNAVDISYDNSKSGISAENVQDALDESFDLVLPTLAIDIDSGSAITVTDGTTTITGTSGANGTFQTRLPSLGTWTVTATLNNQSTSDSIDIVNLGNDYTLTLSYFSATLTVAAVTGAIVTASATGATYTATANSSGKATLTVKRAGNYTITASYDDIPSDSTTVNIETNGSNYTATVSFITLTVTVDSGSAITVTDSTHTYTRTGTGTDVFYLPNTGTWTVTATNGEYETSDTVEVTAYEAYTLTLLYFDPILENNTPEQIQKAAQLGIAPDLWSVGDTHTITLNGTVNSVTFSNETYCVFIIGFNHNSDIEGNNTIHFQFGKMADGETDIAFVDKYYASTSAFGGFQPDSGGWEKCKLRSDCETFRSVMPQEWQDVISTCTKYSSDSTTTTAQDGPSAISTEDAIWLLGVVEVTGSVGSYAATAEKTYQKRYTYYANGNSRKKYKHTSTSTVCAWYTRSKHYSSTGMFVSIGESGSPVLYPTSANVSGEDSSIVGSRAFAPGFMVA